MSQYTASDGGSQDDSTVKNAAHEASAVTGTARDAARGVAETSAHEAAAVAGEAKDQLRDLVSQTGRQLSDQASSQQQRLAESLGSVGGDLSRMADADENGGLAGELVRRAADHVSTVGSWLGDRDPQQLLEDVKGFARRRPGTFIAVAALAGIVVGRLSRSLAAGASSASGSASTAGSAPAAPPLPPAPPVPPTSGSTIGDAPVGGAALAGTAGVGAAGVETVADGIGPVDTGLDDTGLVTDVDSVDPPVYAESAARLDSTREGGLDERPGTV
ncbi:hypothetical protein ACFWZW_00125 [Microbacterium enclense]|uniref:hypothetical protein n=1 Tax=Microbacterium enclense TaxID=993073 RepID=UPI0036DD6C20